MSDAGGKPVLKNRLHSTHTHRDVSSAKVLVFFNTIFHETISLQNTRRRKKCEAS